MKETVTISREDYDNFIKCFVMYQALEANGVDSWEGYDSAIDEFRATHDQLKAEYESKYVNQD
jgi:hypothetical protein